MFDDTDVESLAARLAASHGQARRAALRARRSAGRSARCLLTWITTGTHGEGFGSPGASRGREAATSCGRRWSAQHTLVKTTASLLSATGITALLGLVFWWLAARTLSVAAVGYG